MHPCRTKTLLTAGLMLGVLALTPERSLGAEQTAATVHGETKIVYSSVLGTLVLAGRSGEEHVFKEVAGPTFRAEVERIETDAEGRSRLHFRNVAFTPRNFELQFGVDVEITLDHIHEPPSEDQEDSSSGDGEDNPEGGGGEEETEDQGEETEEVEGHTCDWSQRIQMRDSRLNGGAWSGWTPDPVPIGGHRDHKLLDRPSQSVNLGLRYSHVGPRNRPTALDLSAKTTPQTMAQTLKAVYSATPRVIEVRFETSLICGGETVGKWAWGYKNDYDGQGQWGVTVTPTVPVWS